MTTLSQLAQLQLELINRARMDPVAEAARYGISLNDFIDPATSGVITADPKQVLAGNNQLTAAAVGHTAQMLAMNSMSHSGIGDFDPATRIANAGYTGNNVRRPENIGTANAFAFNPDPTKLADRGAIRPAVFRRTAIWVCSAISQASTPKAAPMKKPAAIASPCSIQATRRSVSA